MHVAVSALHDERLHTVSYSVGISLLCRRITTRHGHEMTKPKMSSRVFKDLTVDFVANPAKLLDDLSLRLAHCVPVVNSEARLS